MDPARLSEGPRGNREEEEEEREEESRRRRRRRDEGSRESPLVPEWGPVQVKNSVVDPHGIERRTVSNS